jgi:WD40 repeat protein
MRWRCFALGSLLLTAALAGTGDCDGQTPNPATGNRRTGGGDWELAATLAGHQGVVKSLAFSPDGQRLLSASLDGQIKVWDTHNRTELASISAHKQYLTAIAVSPSGELFASAGGVPAEVKLWDAQTLRLRVRLSYPRPVYSLAFSRDSELIAAAGDRDVSVWKARGGSLVRKLAVGMWPILGLAFSPDSRVLYVGGMPDKGHTVAANSGIVRAWDYPSGAKLDEVELPYPVSGISLSEDGRTLAASAVALHVFDVVTDNGRVQLTKRFSALDEQSRRGVPIFHEQFRQVAISPDGRIVAAAAGSPGPLAADAGHVALFALPDGRRMARLQAPRPGKGAAKAGDYDISAVAFSPDGKLLASTGKQRIVTLWAAPSSN